jgi:multisubunit Na+/H+ antiporter MnhE subunit
MTNDLLSALTFIVGLVISTIIIYVTTKLFGQKEGIGRGICHRPYWYTHLFCGILHFWQQTRIRISRRYNLADSA